MKFNLFLILFLLGSVIYAQDWGSSETLNPSFSNDNRFNKTLDLSGTLNQTPDVPDWTQDLIIYQMRIDKFGDDYTINAALAKLQETQILQKLGVTGLVLNPIAQPWKWTDPNFSDYGPEFKSYYTHLEPHKLDPDLGTEADFKAFVDYLHSIGVKVFVDFEFHGVFDRNVFKYGKYTPSPAFYDATGPTMVSSLITDHPEFFAWKTETNGDKHPTYTDWNSAELKWTYKNGDIDINGNQYSVGHNQALKDWYKSILKNDWVKKFDLDGFRLDLEPYEVAAEVGYSYWKELIVEVKTELNKDIILIPEDGNADTQNAFAFAQENFGVDNPRVGACCSHVKDFMVSEYMTNYPAPINLPGYENTVSPVNIVDEVKDTDGDDFSRIETYYTSCISSHDKHEYPSRGHLVYFGYGMLFQPFIPFWFMGDEFNVRKNVPYGDGTINTNNFFDIIYNNRLTWSDYTTNQDHFNEVRKMIYIRKKYKNLIGPSTHRLKDKQMVKVPVVGTQPDLPAYGYYSTGAEKVGIIVTGTKETAVNNLVVKLPLVDMNLQGYTQYEFHNLLTDTKVVLSPKAGTADEFIVDNLEAWGNLIYRVEPVDPNAVGENILPNLNVYPNPFKNDISVKGLDANMVIGIEMLDVLGKTVYSSNEINSGEIIINSSGFDSGVYIVRVNATEGIVVKKLIK